MKKAITVADISDANEGEPISSKFITFNATFETLQNILEFNNHERFRACFLDKKVDNIFILIYMDYKEKAKMRRVIGCSGKINKDEVKLIFSKMIKGIGYDVDRMLEIHKGGLLV